MHYVHTSFCAFYFINVRLFITRSRKYWHFSRPHVFVFGHVSDTDTWPTRPDTCRTHLKRVQNYFGNFFEIRTRPNTASEHGGVENVIFFEENASFLKKKKYCLILELEIHHKTHRFGIPSHAQAKHVCVLTSESRVAHDIIGEFFLRNDTCKFYVWSHLRTHAGDSSPSRYLLCLRHTGLRLANDSFSLSLSLPLVSVSVKSLFCFIYALFNSLF